MNLLTSINNANLGTWVNCFDDLPSNAGDYLVRDGDGDLHVLHFSTSYAGFSGPIAELRWCADSLAGTDYDDSNVTLDNDDIVSWLKLNKNIN